MQGISLLWTNAKEYIGKNLMWLCATRSVYEVEPILKEKLEEFEKYLMPIVEKMIEDKMKSLVK
jgi:hypothetical protein